MARRPAWRDHSAVDTAPPIRNRVGAVTGSTAPSGGSCIKTLPANPIVNNANAITVLMMIGMMDLKRMQRVRQQNQLRQSLKNTLILLRSQKNRRLQQLLNSKKSRQTSTLTKTTTFLTTFPRFKTQIMVTISKIWINPRVKAISLIQAKTK